MRKKTRMAVLLSVMLIFGAVYFQFYCSKNMMHHCSNQHCAICFVIHEANELLHHLIGDSLFAIAVGSVFLLVVKRYRGNGQFIEDRTLIKWKVRMNH